MLRCGHGLGKEVNDIIKTNGGYSDVAVQSDLVYAAKLDRPVQVDVYDSSTWRRLRQIQTPCSLTEHIRTSYHTLHVSDEHILLCCVDKNKLQVLSHSGELLQTHGRSREEATDDDIIGHTTSGKPVYGPGVLSHPRLCQVDAEGSVLVADNFNRRLQVMRADGIWNVIDLDRVADRPKAAVLCNASLYVANYGKMIRFSVP